jgi:hypothetical protein
MIMKNSREHGVREANLSCRMILNEVAAGRMRYILYYWPDSGRRCGREFFQLDELDNEELDARLKLLKKIHGDKIESVELTPELAETANIDLLFYGPNKYPTKPNPWPEEASSFNSTEIVV